MLEALRQARDLNVENLLAAFAELLGAGWDERVGIDGAEQLAGGGIDRGREAEAAALRRYREFDAAEVALHGRVGLRIAESARAQAIDVQAVEVHVGGQELIIAFEACGLGQDRGVLGN